MDRPDKVHQEVHKTSPLVTASPTVPDTSFTKTLDGILSGGITGGIEICITFPTEYVKTQLQLDERSGKSRRYKGPVNCVQLTIKDYGFRGLYRGLPVLLCGSIPKSAIRFGTFEELKRRCVDEKGYLSPSKRLLCGFGAGINEAIFAVTPMETIKVKFMNDQISAKPKFRGLFHGIREIIRAEGIRGVYKGLAPTLLKQSSNQAVRLFVVETLKHQYRGDDIHKEIPMVVTGCFGAIAGACSVYANTPVDVIKTRLQGLDAHKYKGTIDCAIQIYKHEGPRAFYKGTVPRLSRVCLDVAITFMIYDKIMYWFKKYRPY